jgi:hypothetical protein
MRTVEEIVTEMEKLVPISKGDREQVHYEADQLLVEAIENMFEQVTSRSTITDLITSYKAVRKWYA